MIGTLWNALAVVLGGLLGITIGGRISERFRSTFIAVLGLFTLALGFQMFLSTENSLIVLGSLLIGVLIGEALGIEEALQKFAGFLQARFTPKTDGEENRFLNGFITASLLFCVGPIAILGSIQEGLTGDYQTLVVKSIMDGIASLAFASSFGIGVPASAFMVLLYQGTLTLLASQLQGLTSTTVMNELTAVGGVILMGMSISSMLQIKKIRIGSFLPALFIVPIVVAVVQALS